MSRGTTTIVLSHRDMVPDVGDYYSDELTGLHGKVLKIDRKLDGRVLLTVRGVAPPQDSVVMREHRTQQRLRAYLCDALHELCDDVGQEDMVDELRGAFGL